MIREILHELEQAIDRADKERIKAFDRDQRFFEDYFLAKRTGLIEAYAIVKEYEREED